MNWYGSFSFPLINSIIEPFPLSNELGLDTKDLKYQKLRLHFFWVRIKLCSCGKWLVQNQSIKPEI